MNKAKRQLACDIHTMLGMKTSPPLYVLQTWDSKQKFNVAHFNPARISVSQWGWNRRPPHEELRLWVTRARLLGIVITGWDDE